MGKGSGTCEREALVLDSGNSSANQTIAAVEKYLSVIGIIKSPELVQSLVPVFESLEKSFREPSEITHPYTKDSLKATLERGDDYSFAKEVVEEALKAELTPQNRELQSIAILKAGLGHLSLQSAWKYGQLRENDPPALVGQRHWASHAEVAAGLYIRSLLGREDSKRNKRMLEQLMHGMDGVHKVTERKWWVGLDFVCKNCNQKETTKASGYYYQGPSACSHVKL